MGKAKALNNNLDQQSTVLKHQNTMIYSPFTVRLLESEHVEEDYLITSFFKTKDAQTSFFYQKKKKKRTNNFHEFEGRFLTGQVSSNTFKVFNGCIAEP